MQEPGNDWLVVMIMWKMTEYRTWWGDTPSTSWCSGFLRIWWIAILG